MCYWPPYSVPPFTLVNTRWVTPLRLTSDHAFWTEMVLCRCPMSPWAAGIAAEYPWSSTFQVLPQPTNFTAFSCPSSPVGARCPVLNLMCYCTKRSSWEQMCSDVQRQIPSCRALCTESLICLLTFLSWIYTVHLQPIYYLIERIPRLAILLENLGLYFSIKYVSVVLKVL